MLSILSLQPVATPPDTTLLKPIAQGLFVLGLCTVAVALPQVRHKISELMQNVKDYFYEPVKLSCVLEDDKTLKSTTRREIEEFDLDLFNG